MAARPRSSGSLTLDGSTITSVEVTADLGQLESDDDRRDGRLREQAIETGRFPTATFTLTSPIELGSVPADGQTLTATATGDLTLHGVTRSVQVPIEARLSGDVVTVTGSIEIAFADYSIERPIVVPRPVDRGPRDHGAAAAFPPGLIAAGAYSPRVDVTIRAFPSRDREFVDFAQAAWVALPEPKTPEALQRALRVQYPVAVVTEQEELARHGEGPLVWYAFRAAAIGERTPLAARDDAGAWAMIDDERRFLEVSDDLAQIAELPAAQMLGHQVEEFSNPADPSIRDDIARLWEEFRSVGALASTLRFDYADGRPRELAFRLVANVDGPGRHRLSVRVLANE